jgi:hypothetical protein
VRFDTPLISTDRRPSVTDTRNPACDEMFDAVNQSLFAIGLQIEHCMESSIDEAVRQQLDVSIQGLHDVIGMIRAHGELHCETYSIRGDG